MSPDLKQQKVRRKHKKQACMFAVDRKCEHVTQLLWSKLQELFESKCLRSAEDQSAAGLDVRMGHSLLCMTGLLFLGTLFYVNAEVPNKPTVILEPSWPQIYSSETVTVRCEGSQSVFVWRDGTLIRPSTSEYRISRATESDSGGYSCCTIADLKCSDIITLTVSYKPKAKLRADNTAVPVGGSVTLTCSVNPSSSSGWKYYWYRDEKSSEALTTQDAVFHSNGQISVSQEGLYRCRGGRGNPVYYTEDSQSVRIGKTVTASNRPVVTLYPNWSEIYRGETITVRCEIHGGDTEWDYEWETNSRIKAPNQNEYRIRSASSSNSGNYRCKGRMKSSQHKTTEWSDSVTLTVSDSK
ncbi:centrosomal protein [Sarotherodon galilaeus]